MSPLARFSSILEPSLGPSWARLAPILGHLGPLDGPKRALTEPSDVPFTGRRLSCSVYGPGAILFRLRAGCYLGAPHGPNCTVILETVPKRKGGRYNAPWASSIRPPIVQMGRGPCWTDVLIPPKRFPRLTVPAEARMDRPPSCRLKIVKNLWFSYDFGTFSLLDLIFHNLNDKMTPRSRREAFQIGSRASRHNF